MKTLFFVASLLLIIGCTTPKTKTITIQHTDSLAIDDKIFYLDSISELDYNRQPIKTAKVVTDTNLVVINRDSIVIKSESHPVVLINDTTDNDGMVTYEFKTIIPQPKYVHIKGYHWEWTSDRYINLQTGSETLFWDNPTLSPNKKMVLAYSSDLVAGFMQNGLQLFKINQDTIIKLFEKEIELWGPDEVKWESDTAIVIKRVKYDNNYNPSYDYLRMIIK